MIHFLKNNLGRIAFGKTASSISISALILIAIIGAFPVSARAAAHEEVGVSAAPSDLYHETSVTGGSAFLPGEHEHSGQIAGWEDMTSRLADESSRFKGQCHQYGEFCLPLSWDEHIQKMRSMPMQKRLDYANRLINQYRYASDTRTYGIYNYWATPLELATKKQGDCKHHAVAKFAILLASGVPESQLRILVLNNSREHYMHAILMVSTGQGVFVLDDQRPNVMTMNDVPFYHPIYSINFDGWWLHEERMAGL